MFFKAENEYPLNFPNLYNNINGYIVDRNSFNTLKPYIDKNQYLDDGVINGFFSLLPTIAKENSLSLVCFDTLFFDKILKNNHISEGFKKWAKKQAVMSKNIWLIPINYIIPEHWTLLVVLHIRPLFFFYSLHRFTRTLVVNGICTFLQNQLKKPVSWSEWTLYAPTDIPSQVNEQGEVGGNCGVHICSWALTIATCSDVTFMEKDIAAARRALASILDKAESNKEKTKLTEKSREPFLSNGNDEEKTIDISGEMEKIKIKYEPPLNFSNTLEFCSVLNLLHPDDYKTNLRRPI